jgi:hypothetical protein
MSQAGALNASGGPTGNVQTLTGNSGGPVAPSGNNINTVGTGSITIAGNPGTSTLTTQLTGLTNHSLLVGAGTPTITSLGAATDGQLPIGSTGNNPVLSTLTAGTGISVTNAPGGITIAATGGSGITTINGDTGSVTGSTVTIYTNGNAGASVSFSGSGTHLTYNNTDAQVNVYVGESAGQPLGGSENSGFGFGALQSIVGGTNNVSIGFDSLANNTNGNFNTAIGNVALTRAGGSYNIGIGHQGGSLYSAGDNDNIAIGNPGASGESNVIRIGTQGTGNNQQNVCYIAGVEGATYSAGSPTPALTYVDTSDGQVVATQAVASSSATSTFGSLVVGTARQNTSTHAIMVNVSMVITAATNATIVLGIGSTNTPTTNTVVTTFSTATTETFSFFGFVPAGYYMLVNTTGTITVGSITTQTCAVG